MEFAVAGRAVSLDRLALWLAAPAVYSEFGPTQPWSDTEVGWEWRSEPWSSRSAGHVSACGAVDAAIAKLVDGHKTCAVSVSGGLDSLAVLVRLSALLDGTGRRAIAVCAEMVDDRGVSNVPFVERLIRDLRIDCELLVVRRGEQPSEEPCWSPAGPRLDALPRTNRRICERAADVGATFVLHGSGADELCGSTRFLLPSLLRARDLAATRRYLGDTVLNSRDAALREGLALIAPWLPQRLRSTAYVAAARPHLADTDVRPLVGAKHRPRVKEWTERWVDELIEWHARQHRDWAMMAAWDAATAGRPIPTPGPLSWASPFEHPAVRDAVRSVALHHRYDGTAGTAYARAKRLIVELFPAATRQLLPRYKQTFTKELGATEFPRAAPTCVRRGLIDAAGLASEHNPLFLARVAAIEEWLARAEQEGYVIA